MAWPRWCRSSSARACCRLREAVIATAYSAPLAQPGGPMSLISFIKDAGEKLFGKGEAKVAQEAAERDASAANVERLNKVAGDAIATYVTAMNLKVDGLDVAFDGATGTVTVSGVAAD